MFGDMNVGVSTGSLKVKKKDPKMKVDTVDRFLAALWMFLMSLAYIGVSFQAPAPTWLGDELVGIVAGVRRQFSRAGAVVYYDFWKEIAERFRNRGDCGFLMALELKMRRSWRDRFAKNVQLESCMMESIVRFAGETRSSLPVAKRSIPNGDPRNNKQKVSPGKGNDPSNGGGAGSSALDRAKKYGDFDPKLRTARFTKDKKPICVGFNVKAGCTFPNCQHEHVCDVKMPNGEACGKDHERFNHQ